MKKSYVFFGAGFAAGFAAGFLAAGFAAGFLAAGLAAGFFMAIAGFLAAGFAAGFLAAAFIAGFFVGAGACATVFVELVVWLAIAVPVRRKADAMRADRNLFMNVSLIKT
jgi:hypothetical protein